MQKKPAVAGFLEAALKFLEGEVLTEAKDGRTEA